MHDGLGFLFKFLIGDVLRKTFSTCVDLIMRRGQVHSMRIDNLCFFFQVEGFLVTLNGRLWVFVRVVLAVIREQLRVWIAHKSVSATSHASTLVTSRELLN